MQENIETMTEAIPNAPKNVPFLKVCKIVCMMTQKGSPCVGGGLSRCSVLSGVKAVS